MMSEQDIVGKLETLGYKNAEIRMALRDVGQVIVAKISAAYLESLPEKERVQLRELPPDTLETYLAEHRHTLPKMPQEEFERIHDETWDDYFRSVA